jgi:hypothetical protein
MTKNVFAGMWEIAAENGMNKSIARFPDVCMSPPSPPAGPIPIPYPDTSFSNNLKSASTTVLIGGKGAALAQKSYYKEPVLGDEAATRTFGANVVTHQITGKTYFQAWCMDVKFENKNVCRHFDITTSNHASGGTTTVPLTALEMQAMAKLQSVVDQGLCPCCKEPLHEWQKDPATNKAYPIETSDQHWQRRINALPMGTPPTPAQLDKRTKAQAALTEFKKLKRESRSRGADGCRNVPASETDDCAIHFNIPVGTRYAPAEGSQKPQSVSDLCSADFGIERRRAARNYWRKQKVGRRIREGNTLHHKTPRQSGGCNSPQNLTPDNAMQARLCQRVETVQSALEKLPV